MTILCAVPGCPGLALDHYVCATHCDCARCTSSQPSELDPKPWLFISDQVFGEFRSDHDKGYHGVSGAYWAFSPRAEYEQDRARYEPIDPSPREGDEHGRNQEPVDDDRR